MIKGRTKGNITGKWEVRGIGRGKMKREKLQKMPKARNKMSFLRCHAAEKYHTKSWFYDLVKRKIKIKSMIKGIDPKKVEKNRKVGKGSGGRRLKRWKGRGKKPCTN